MRKQLAESRVPSLKWLHHHATKSMFSRAALNSVRIERNLLGFRRFDSLACACNCETPAKSKV